MTAELRKPTERTCESCSREEVWDDDAETWVVDDDPGTVHCIHEWDINGSFLPVELE